MRVLLADPDDIFLEIVQSYLCRFRYEVEIATDGLNCITSLREFVPDALVIDQDLAWGGCESILERMAEETLLFNIAIILTGEARDSNHFLAQLRLPFDFLPKPYRLGYLLKHLDDAISTKSRLPSPAEAV